MRKKILLVVPIVVFIFAFFNLQKGRVIDALPALAQVSERNKTTWPSFKSKYFTIVHHPDVNLDSINRRIRIYFRDIAFDRNSPDRDDRVQGKIAFKFDKIFRKVKKILDMRPAQVDATIKIFKSQQELNKHYLSVFHEPNSSRSVSYYIHSHKTIYTTERAISADVIAHEMAHVIQRHYFLVRPPANVGELMAQYVELHLND